jgi:hypothetical protein
MKQILQVTVTRLEIQILLHGFYIKSSYSNKDVTFKSKGLKSSVRTCLLYFSSSNLSPMLVCSFPVWEVSDEPPLPHSSDKLKILDVPEL